MTAPAGPTGLVSGAGLSLVRLVRVEVGTARRARRGLPQA